MGIFDRRTLMRKVYKNANIHKFGKADIAVADGVVEKIAPDVCVCGNDVIYDLNNAVVFPGFVDVHVHFREPGFSYKETIKSGSRAAARGGFTHVCTMPNLNPVPDGTEGLKVQLDIIKKDACIGVHPFGAITVGQNGGKLSDMESMADFVIGFSDDGRGVQSEEMMRDAMKMAKKLGKVISAHCEDDSLLKGGCIHDGEYARAHGIKGICSESEWGPIRRDINLASQTGCAYHVCHISSKESVELIRRAKADGVNITCETAPHYLVFNDSMLCDSGRFRMNPPIRSEADRLALIGGICDGTVDMVATDHAPHSADEKSRGLCGSLNGVVGIETSFAVLYTHLVRKNIITLDRLIKLMSAAPRARFGIGGGIEVGGRAEFTVFDLDSEFTVDTDEFLSMGRSTPFDGMKLFGRCMMTVYGDEIVWRTGE